MGLYNIVNPASMQAGQPEDVSQVLANFQAIQTILNGGIDDVNIRATAALNPSKILAFPTDITKLLRGDGTWGTPTMSPTDATKVLRGDGSWGYPPGTIMGYGVGQSISTTGTTFASGQNWLAANLSFTADGVSRYMVQWACQDAQIAFSGVSTIAVIPALDGAAYGLGLAVYSPSSGFLTNINGASDLGIPSAGSHTINAKVYGGSGSVVTVSAGGPLWIQKVT